MEYPIEEYMMSFAEIAAAEIEEEEQQPDGELADGFVYDDEFTDN